jgi:neutral ceramidase
MYLLGKGKADITAFEKGVGMLGFGMHFHTMEGIETPLFARAFVIQEPSTKFKIVYVNCELAFITNSLKQGVLSALDSALPHHGIQDETLILSAQHSHSTPAGYAYYGIYNISVPGFNINVYNKLVAGIVEAIVEAHQKFEECELAYNEGVFDLSKNVAFNRSPLQYNQNPEVDEKITQDSTNKGVDRTMYQLMFLTKEKKCLGLINWFGVHTTSVSNDLNKLCADNKGYAATFTEEVLGEECLSAFAQGTCGDITPRFKYNPKRKYQRGKWEGEFEDDYKSAAYNGQLQSEKSLEILANTNENNVVKNALPIDSAILHVDFTKVLCNPKFANGNKDAHTGPANMGLDFLGGAYVDGPGMHPAIVKVLRKFNKFRKWKELRKAKKVGGDFEREVLHKYKTQGNKSLAIETTETKIFWH